MTQEKNQENYNQDVSKNEKEQEGVKENQSKEQKEIDISSYVSNLDKNIYAISGLPEEFIATLFAWVSRSPKSFREHLKQALKDHDVATAVDQFKELDNKAKKFHEKWTVGYGHSSVAEHAFAHVGIENVSRLASAELELANPFLSITEYSQRYQKPKRYDWFNPFKKRTKNYKATQSFFNQCFNTFEKLIDDLIKYMRKNKEYDRLSDKAISKIAFEDARYVLPLAMYTQLGMTANGRAWRDALAHLDTSDHKEIRDMKENIKKEISKVLPVLLKYSDASDYQILSNEKMKAYFDKVCKIEGDYKAKLLSVEPESILIDKIIASLIIKHEGYSYEAAIHKARLMDDQRKKDIILDYLDEMKHFDQAPEEFKHIVYHADFLVSEANWHQLLRHNRKTNFTYSRPTPYLGYTIPPRIKDAGLEEDVVELIEESKALYEDLKKGNTSQHAEYVILNAHHRRIRASFDLWEAYHLINLRTSNEAQWDIRETMEELYKQLNHVHPLLISKAKRR